MKKENIIENSKVVCKYLLVNGNRCRNEVRIKGYCLVHFQKKIF